MKLACRPRARVITGIRKSASLKGKINVQENYRFIKDLNLTLQMTDGGAQAGSPPLRGGNDRHWRPRDQIEQDTLRAQMPGGESDRVSNATGHRGNISPWRVAF